MKHSKSPSQNPHSAIRIPQFRHGGNIHAFAQARGVALENVLDFSASINPLGWPPKAAVAYRRVLSHIGHYPEPYADTLVAALAEYHCLKPASILVGNGSTQLIYLLARALTARRVLLIAPLFTEHETAFRFNNAQIDHFLLRPPRFVLSCQQLKLALANRYDVLVLTNPNSPTGAVVSRDQMKEIAQLCQHLRTSFVVDETFIDWIEAESLKELAAYSPHVIVLRSLTKFFAVPGLRIGYLIAHPRVIARLHRQLEPWSVNTVAQEVALACLHDQQFVQRSRTFMERERVWFFEQLATVRGVHPFPSFANFLLVRIVQQGMNALTLTQELATHNILIRPCHDFHGLGRQFLRVAVRMRAENVRLLAALRVALR